MKIAVTISGQPRHHRKGFLQNKKYFIDKYNADIYLHSWLGAEFKRYRYGNIRKLYKATPEVYNQLLEWYQPKDYLFEKPINFDASGIEDTGRINSQMGGFMSAYRAWSLIENSGIQYDYIVRTRYDLYYDHYIRQDCPILNNIGSLDPKKLHIFRRDDARDPNLEISLNDYFAVGGPEIMKTFYNLFPNMIYYQFVDKKYHEEYGPESKSPWGVNKFFNECVMRYHIRESHIEVVPHPTDYEPLWYDGARILE